MKILLCKIIRWLKSKMRKNTETNLVKFARVELDKLLNGCGDKNSESYLMQKQINDDIIEIVKSFSKQGHSGFSASYALNIIKKLLNWKPILPLTGEDDEWNDCGYFDREGNRVFQNRRCSAVFKDVNNDTGESRVKYIDKYVISDNGGITWFSSRHVLNKLGLDETISFPFTVPENPERIYIKYTEDVPVGESSDNFIDITNNKDEINRLRQEWNEKFHKDDKKMTKTEKIEELKNVLKLALELAEPNHECEKCSLKEQCKEKYRKLLEKECGEDILEEVDDEFCYPIVDGDEKDCLIRTRIKELLKKD